MFSPSVSSFVFCCFFPYLHFVSSISISSSSSVSHLYLFPTFISLSISTSISFSTSIFFISFSICISFPPSSPLHLHLSHFSFHTFISFPISISSPHLHHKLFLNLRFFLLLYFHFYPVLLVPVTYLILLSLPPGILCLTHTFHQLNTMYVIQIYRDELENIPEFNNFNDWLHSFSLYRGKKTSEDDDDEHRVVGKFKVFLVLML